MFPELQLNAFATGLDLANARACARASAMAYEQFTIRDSSTDTQVLVLETSTAVIVAFRGTSSLQDFITNAKVLKTRTRYPDIQVHQGFDNAVGAVFDDIMTALGRMDSSKPVFFCGHSLGGALAMLAAYFYFRELVAGTTRPLPQVYTFGAPRVGDKSFAVKYNAALKATTFAFVNQGDPVPLVPTLAMGYRDNGTEQFIKSGIFSDDLSLVEDPWIAEEIFADLLGRFTKFRLRRFLKLLPDHEMAEYERKIKAL